jgi:hypothetical protein
MDAKTRRWIVRASALLLLLQAATLAGVNLYKSLQIDWATEFADVMLSVAALETILLDAIFIPLALVALLTAIGFFFARRIAWLAAMTVQGLILVSCLLFYYFGYRSAPLYGIMLYAILVVLYINTTDVRMAFYARKPPETRVIR